jgi:hypothetical protein
MEATAWNHKQGVAGGTSLPDASLTVRANIER